MCKHLFQSLPHPEEVSLLTRAILSYRAAFYPPSIKRSLTPSLQTLCDYLADLFVLTVYVCTYVLSFSHHQDRLLAGLVGSTTVDGPDLLETHKHWKRSYTTSRIEL